MSITNFSELQTSILGWAERQDLSSLSTDFISLADSRIKKKFGATEMRLREMETTTDLTPSSGACTIPSDYIAMKRVQARTSPPRRLEYKPPDWLDEAYPSGAAGPPAYYTVEGGSLRMYPLTTSDIRIVYWGAPAALTSLNTTNWLITKYPDIYLFAGLIELELYAQNDTGAQRWLTAFDTAVNDLKESRKSDSMTSGTSRSASERAQ